MNRHRLQVLKRALIAYSKRRGNLKFNLAQWAAIPEKYRDENAIRVVKAAMEGKNYCGTTACACGLAATLPSFQRDGLKLIKNPNPGHAENYPFTVKYKGRINGEAVMKFFDIGSEEVDRLFVEDHYTPSEAKNPLAVVKRIDALLALNAD